jgi:hypothetical protein
MIINGENIKYWHTAALERFISELQREWQSREDCPLNEMKEEEI